MTPAELRSLGSKHPRGWQTRLADEVGVNVRTVRRWLSGQTTMHEVFERRVREVIAGWPL